MFFTRTSKSGGRGQDIVISIMEKEKEIDLGKSLRGAALLLKDLGVALVAALPSEQLLARSFIQDLEPIAVMLRLEKGSLKQLSSIVASATTDAERANSADIADISPVRLRLLTHACGKMITQRAQIFIDENRDTLRQAIMTGSHSQLLDKTVQKVEEMFAGTPEEEHAWESLLGKLSASLGKTLQTLSEDHW